MFGLLTMQRGEFSLPPGVSVPVGGERIKKRRPVIDSFYV